MTQVSIFLSKTLLKQPLADLDSSKTSRPDYIPVMVLKTCDPLRQLLCILAGLFNIFLKESGFPDSYCFPDCWEVSSVFPELRNIGERSAAEKSCPVSFLYCL